MNRRSSNYCAGVEAASQTETRYNKQTTSLSMRQSRVLSASTEICSSPIAVASSLSASLALFLFRSRLLLHFIASSAIFVCSLSSSFGDCTAVASS
jgi:hypothetical protein